MNEKSKQKLRDTKKGSNKQWGFPEGKERNKQAETIFEEIMAKILQNVMKDINKHIHNSQ